MTREELNNKIHSKIVNDELYEDEIMEDIMQLVDVHVKKQLRIGVVVTRKTDIKNALLIIGLSFVVSGMILITQTLIGVVPISVGGVMFGSGLGIRTK